MTLLDAGGKPIPQEVKGRELVRFQRPPLAGFRPEIWLLIETADERYQLVREKPGTKRLEAVGPAVELQEAGALATALATQGPFLEAPGIMKGMVTALFAIAVLSSVPDPDNGGEAAAEPANDDDEGRRFSLAEHARENGR